MCEASLYPAAQFETLSYGCSLVLPAFLAGTSLGPMWDDIVHPNPRTMKLWLWGRDEERERARENGREGGAKEKKWETGKEIKIDRENN